MTTVLDIAKFNLDANRAAVQARVDLLKAYSDFNHRMMEAAKLQAEVMAQNIANELQRLKLRQLEDAFRDYKQARSQSMKEQKRVAKELERVDVHGRKMPSLLLGETLPPIDVVKSWVGLEYFVKTADSDTLGRLTQIKAPSSALKGAHFSKNRTPNNPCDDPPTGISHAWPLLQWARKKLYLPRIGSPPHSLLGKVMRVLGDGAERRRKAIQKELDAVTKELLTIREKGWKNLDVEKFHAKAPSAA